MQLAPPRPPRPWLWLVVRNLLSLLTQILTIRERLLAGKCKEEKFLPHESNDDAILTCAVRQRSFHVSRDRCCALCSNRFKNKWCAWAEGEAASKFFPGSGGRQTCSVCPQTAMVQSQEAIGVVQWIPAWDDVAKYQG